MLAHPFYGSVRRWQCITTNWQTGYCIVGLISISRNGKLQNKVGMFMPLKHIRALKSYFYISYFRPAHQGYEWYGTANAIGVMACFASIILSTSVRTWRTLFEFELLNRDFYLPVPMPSSWRKGSKAFLWKLAIEKKSSRGLPAHKGTHPIPRCQMIFFSRAPSLLSIWQISLGTFMVPY